MLVMMGMMLIRMTMMSMSAASMMSEMMKMKTMITMMTIIVIIIIAVISCVTTAIHHRHFYQAQQWLHDDQLPSIDGLMGLSGVSKMTWAHYQNQRKLYRLVKA
eukprot:7010766-Karenia_brevis.AAC.1